MSKKALNVQDDSRCKGIQGNTSKSEIKCVCLNARSIINKKTELNIMVDDIKPHIIGITESWANNDITNAELGLEGYVMFRKDRIGRRGGGVLLYIKDTIPAYEVQLQEEADCNEAIWCNLVTGHTTVIIGVVYRCPTDDQRTSETAMEDRRLTIYEAGCSQGRTEMAPDATCRTSADLHRRTRRLQKRDRHR